MNRKQFIESNGATCANWTWSWSFVNHQDRFVIFGAWDIFMDGDNAQILSEEWELSEIGRKQPAYTQALEHIRLVEQDDYGLRIFKMIYSDANKDKAGLGPAKIDGIVETLEDRFLSKVGNKWYASTAESLPNIAEEIANPGKFIEGASMQVSINKYERNRSARKICLEHHGYNCSVCDFSFEDGYGEIGREYIHVHHLIPISELKQEYEIDPVRDLAPVCPNCHAMIHKYTPALTVEILKSKLKIR